MKKTLLGIAIAGLLATAATAGTLNDPIVENDVIAADAVATSSIGPMALLLLLTAVITAAAID